MKSLHGQVPHIFTFSECHVYFPPLCWMFKMYCIVWPSQRSSSNSDAMNWLWCPYTEWQYDGRVQVPMAQGCEQYHTIWDIYSLLVLLGDCHNGCKHWPGGWNSLRPRQTWRHSRPCLQVKWTLFDEHLRKHRLSPPCWNYKDQVVDLLKIVNPILLLLPGVLKGQGLQWKRSGEVNQADQSWHSFWNFLFILRGFGLTVMTQKGGQW